MVSGFSTLSTAHCSIFQPLLSVSKSIECIMIYSKLNTDPHIHLLHICFQITYLTLGFFITKLLCYWKWGLKCLFRRPVPLPLPQPSSTPYIICSRTATILILTISGQAVKICLYYILFINHMWHFTSQGKIIGWGAGGTVFPANSSIM